MRVRVKVRCGLVGAAALAAAVLAGCGSGSAAGSRPATTTTTAGRSSTSLSTAPHQVWSLTEQQLGDRPRAEAVVIGPSDIYYLAGATDHSLNLVARDRSSGQLRWEAPLRSYAKGPALAGGLVLVLATDTAQLLAFDAASGAQRWAAPANANAVKTFYLYPAGQLVLAVQFEGNDPTVTALRLRDGSTAWKHAGAVVWSVAGDRVALAESGGSGTGLVTVDLSSGSELGRSVRSGSTPPSGTRSIIPRDEATFSTDGSANVRIDGRAFSAPGPVLDVGRKGETVYVLSGDASCRLSGLEPATLRPRWSVTGAVCAGYNRVYAGDDGFVVLGDDGGSGITRLTGLAP